MDGNENAPMRLRAVLNMIFSVFPSSDADRVERRLTAALRLVNYPIVNPTASVFVWPERISALRARFENMTPDVILSNHIPAILDDLTGPNGLQSLVRNHL